MAIKKDYFSFGFNGGQQYPQQSVYGGSSLQGSQYPQMNSIGGAPAYQMMPSYQAPAVPMQTPYGGSQLPGTQSPLDAGRDRASQRYHKGPPQAPQRPKISDEEYWREQNRLALEAKAKERQQALTQKYMQEGKSAYQQSPDMQGASTINGIQGMMSDHRGQKERQPYQGSNRYIKELLGGF